MFSATTYIKRRDQLRREVGSGIIFLVGNNDSPMNYLDNPYHFRQDSTFLYFLGLNRSGLFAILDADQGVDKVFGDDYTVEDFVWRGKQPTISEEASAAGVYTTGTIKELKDFLGNCMKTCRAIHFLPPYRTETAVTLHHLLDINLLSVNERSSVSLIKAVVAQRSIKSDDEIKEIGKAVNTSVDMHVAAMTMAKPGIREVEIVAEMVKIALAEGGNISFPVIATINGQTLHNHHYGNILKSGKLFLLDCGAETEMGYSGDLSSTFPVDTKFTSRQKEIYQVTLNAHTSAVNALRPGIRNAEIHRIACISIARSLRELGFMKGDPEEAVQAGAHALFFPCGTGHMMGLDVHDMENLGEEYVGYEGNPKSLQFGLKSLRLARELQPGFVITIEPGIYFIPELIDLWIKEKKFPEFLNYEKIIGYKDFGGIRNEENWLIKSDGKQLLGKPKPMTIEAIETLRSGA